MQNPTQPSPWHSLPNAPRAGTTIGAVAALPDGQPTWLELDTGAGPQAPFRVLLLRSGSNVKAFVNRCAHFGVPLAAKASQLIFQPHISITCNVHYARYRWSDGACLSGECAGEGLIPIPLNVTPDGILHIADTAP